MHEAAGYRVARWFTTLRRDLAEPIPEPGPVRVIPFTPDRSEGMRLAHNAAFADHWGSEPWTAERWEEGIIGDPGFRPDLSFLVVEGDVVIGYAINEAYPDDFARLGFSEAWVGALGVRPGRRRRGVARALLVHSMTAFRDAGFDRATLGVDSENPTGALGLYESVGFGPQRRWITYLRDVARP
jgi:ribosomal protein S18 acetylase RimI-like enzyme